MSTQRKSTAELDRELKESNGLGIAWLIGLLVYGLIASQNPDKFPGDTEWFLATPFLAVAYYYHLRIALIEKEILFRQELSKKSGD